MFWKLDHFNSNVQYWMIWTICDENWDLLALAMPDNCWTVVDLEIGQMQQKLCSERFWFVVEAKLYVRRETNNRKMVCWLETNTIYTFHVIKKTNLLAEVETATSTSLTKKNEIVNKDLIEARNFLSFIHEINRFILAKTNKPGMY